MILAIIAGVLLVVWLVSVVWSLFYCWRVS
jgi:hypothetical protein